MKVKTPNLLKKIIAALSNKTNELRIRIMIFFLVHKNLDKTASLSHSLHALVSHHHQRKKNDEEDDIVGDEASYLIQNHQEGEQENENEQLQHRNASLLMHYNNVASKMASNKKQDFYASDVEEYQHHIQAACQEYEEQPTSDLTHALFKESEAEMENESEVDGGGFNGGGVAASAVDIEEEDIDHAADLFIQRFKRQMQLQKQLSLERHQTLLHSNA